VAKDKAERHADDGASGGHPAQGCLLLLLLLLLVVAFLRSKCCRRRRVRVACCMMWPVYESQSEWGLFNSDCAVDLDSEFKSESPQVVKLKVRRCSRRVSGACTACAPGNQESILNVVRVAGETQPPVDEHVELSLRGQIK
jgi:hypothetical protein